MNINKYRLAKQDKYRSLSEQISILVLFCVGLAMPLMAQAAQVGLETERSILRVGDEFKIDVVLDSGDKEINAVEGVILLPQTLLSVEKISDANSIISLWVERPRVENGEIRFAGIVPGGHKGKGHVFSVSLKAAQLGQGGIEIKDFAMYLQDGLGTKVEASSSVFDFEIVEEELLPLIERRTPSVFSAPPEPFIPIISRDESVFEDKWFAAFATQDKTSGIAYYEIHETTRKKEATRIDAKKWIATESPYLLKDQKLRSYIYVKAVNNEGLERIEVIEPEKPYKWYENWWIWSIIVVVISGLWMFLKRR